MDSVFVNGRSRPEIFKNMKERIERGDIEAERAEAIKVESFLRISTVFVVINAFYTRQCAKSLLIELANCRASSS